MWRLAEIATKYEDGKLVKRLLLEDKSFAFSLVKFSFRYNRYKILKNLPLKYVRDYLDLERTSLFSYITEENVSLLTFDISMKRCAILSGNITLLKILFKKNIISTEDFKTLSYYDFIYHLKMPFDYYLILIMLGMKDYLNLRERNYSLEFLNKQKTLEFLKKERDGMEKSFPDYF